MLTSNSTSADPNSIGLFTELDVILAVVIGGTSLTGGRFSLWGTLLGAFIIETMNSFVIIAISPRSTDVFTAGVVVVVCLLQSPKARRWFGGLNRRPTGRRTPPPTVPPTAPDATPLAHLNLFEAQVTNVRGRTRTVDVYTTPSVLLALGLVLVAFGVLHYTHFGRTVYAVGGSEPSASLMGLAVDRTKVMVYAISGFCAGLSGLLFSFYTASGDPVAGIGYELNAIAAVVIGGTLLSGGAGYAFGSVLGVLTLGTIYAYKEFDGNLNTGWTRILIGGLVLFFIVLQRVIASRRWAR